MSDHESQGRRCPECGSPVGDTDKFCIACGHRMEAPADADAVQGPIVGATSDDGGSEPEAGASGPSADETAAFDSGAGSADESEEAAGERVERRVAPDHELDPVVAADWSTDPASGPDDGSYGAASDGAASDGEPALDEGSESDGEPGQGAESDGRSPSDRSPESEAALTTVMHPSDVGSDGDWSRDSEAALTTVLDTSQTGGSEGEGVEPGQEAEGQSPDESSEAGSEEAEKAEAEKALRRRRGIIIGIIVGCAALAIGGIIAAWYFISRGSAPVPVPITVSADGYSTDCTSIPVEITSVSQGRRVETETVFVRGGTSKISLPPGSYTLSFPASPLTPSGILYETPKEPITVTVDPGNGAEAAVTGNDQEAVFTLSTALDETDEMIQDAYEWAIKDPSQADRAVELRDMAQMVHDNAVAEQEEEERRAEEERQRQEEEERRQQEEQQRQQEEQQALANALNSIQGTWTSNVQGGVEDLIIANDQATFYLHLDDGSEDSAGPYTVAVGSTSTTSQYEFTVTGTTETGEQTVARLTYVPSSPNTLTGYIIGTGGDTIVTYTKA